MMRLNDTAIYIPNDLTNTILKALRLAYMGPEIAVNDLNEPKSENLVLRNISLKFTLMYVGVFRGKRLEYF